MDSTRPIPFKAAAASVAYGKKPTQATARAGAAIKPPASGGSAPNGASGTVSKLVSGRVDSPVSRGQGFDAPRGAPMPNASGSLQMYTRAADRVEVATAAHLGRILDTRA